MADNADVEAGPVISIHSISYAPVSTKRPQSDYWAKCLPGHKLDELVRQRFSGYVRRCYEGEESVFQEVNFSTADGKFLKKKLDEMRKCALTEKNKDRREITQELANALCRQMDNSGLAKPGGIFVVQALIDEEEFMAIVKLDFGHQVVVALQAAQPDAELFGQEFERALSEDAKKFRKGVIVPSPKEGDAYSAQKDGSAEYWRLFVGAEPIRPSLNASRAVMGIAEEALLEEGLPMTAKVALDIVEKANKIDKPSAKELAQVVKTAGGLKKSVASLTERLDKKMEKQTIAGMLEVKTIRYGLGHGLTWTVPANLVRQRIVTVEPKGHDIVITIKDAHLTETPQFDTK